MGLSTEVFINKNLVKSSLKTTKLDHRNVQVKSTIGFIKKTTLKDGRQQQNSMKGQERASIG